MHRFISTVFIVGFCCAALGGCDPRKGACLDACNTNQAAVDACNKLGEENNNRQNCLDQLAKNEASCKQMCEEHY
jgi:hypothetical protein